jgi:ankyrin repeat protein
MVKLFIPALALLLTALPTVAASQLDLPTLNERLMAAVLANDAVAVASLLQNGARADRQGGRSDGVTPLMVAASGSRSRPSPIKEPALPANQFPPDLVRDDLPVLKLLLKYGAELNARDALGRTALWWASVFAGKLANTQFLLAQHADVDAIDADGETPLFGAVRADRDVRMIQTLVDAHADVNIRGRVGGTGGVPVLHLALGNSELLEVLLRARANPNATDRTSRTALMMVGEGPAASSIARRLLDAGADVNAADHTGMTVLVQAARRGDRAFVQQLLQRGAAVDDRAAEWALEEAAYSDKGDVVRLLLEDGVNAKGFGRLTYHLTILMRAAQYGRIGVVDSLLAFGADINAIDDLGETALMWTATAENPDMIRFLLSKGAHVNAQDTAGFTALTKAAANGYVQNVRALLEGGADPSITTNAGDTALAWATKNKRAAVVMLLSGRQ